MFHSVRIQPKRGRPRGAGVTRGARGGGVRRSIFGDQQVGAAAEIEETGLFGAVKTGRNLEVRKSYFLFYNMKVSLIYRCIFLKFNCVSFFFHYVVLIALGMRHIGQMQLLT